MAGGAPERMDDSFVFLYETSCQIVSVYRTAGNPSWYLKFSTRLRVLKLHSQRECDGGQETRKCHDGCPNPNNVEALRAPHLLLPILGWRTELPVERGTVDWHGADLSG